MYVILILVRNHNHIAVLLRSDRQLVLEVDQFQVLRETADSCVGALITTVVLQDTKGLGAHLLRVALILLHHVLMAV